MKVAQYRFCWTLLLAFLYVLQVGDAEARDSEKQILNENEPIVERSDEFGNRTIYRSGAGGRVRSITHQRNHVGTWTDRWITNAAGKPMAEIIDAESAFGRRVGQELREIGIVAEPAVPEPEFRWIGERVQVRSRYAAVTEWQGLPITKNGETVLSRQRTQVGGQSITVEKVWDGNRIVVRDDRGGWRYELWGADGLMLAKDRHGVLLRVRQRDRLGRPTEIEIGEVGLLRFEFSDGTPLWTAKELVDRRSGEVVFRWETALRVDQVVVADQDLRTRPRPSATVRLPGYGDIVEWDATLYPGGMVLAGINGVPFALLPYDGQGEILHSLTLDEARHTALGWDRIDYDDQQIHLHFLTDAADAESPPQTAILTMPRRWSTPVPETKGSSPSLLMTDRSSTTPISGGGSDELAPRPQPCPPPNVGCVCWAWNSGVGISCPDPPPGGGSPGGGGGEGGGGGDPGGTLPPAPGSQILSPSQRRELDLAMNRAKGRLANHATCRALFNNLDRNNGTWVIDNSNYRWYGSSSSCTGSVALYTHVNSLNVYMCQPFVSLPDDLQAALVIHEAMHSAGQKESPQYGPGYPTTNELTNMVRSACHL